VKNSPRKWGHNLGCGKRGAEEEGNIGIRGGKRPVWYAQSNKSDGIQDIRNSQLKTKFCHLVSPPREDARLLKGIERAD